MAVPKQRQNKSRRDRRRGGQRKMKVLNLISCPNCSQPTWPHRVCPNCGHYKGREIITPKLKVKKAQ